MSGLVKESQIKAVSFDVDLVKSNKTVNIIIKLLKSAIEKNIALKEDDIIEAYLDFAFSGGRRTIYRKALDSSYFDPSKSNGIVDRESMKKRSWYVRRMAKMWFEKGLGQAILKGKLIAIPIIEID